MSRVARELGAATMSLYRHVSAKDELLAHMVDAAFAAAPTRRQDETWRAGLTRWATPTSPSCGGIAGSSGSRSAARR